MTVWTAVWVLGGYAVVLFGLPVAVGYFALWHARRSMRKRHREIEAILVDRFDSLAESVRDGLIHSSNRGDSHA